MLRPSKPIQTFARVTLLLGVMVVPDNGVLAQAPGVPIYAEGWRERSFQTGLTNTIGKLRESGRAIRIETVRDQLRRGACALNLAPTKTRRLTAREVWEQARQSHLRVGWFYLCTKCNEWHLDLAGGYALTKDGAVATCYHVVSPPRDARDGILIAANDTGKAWPVTEILAASRPGDACIMRIAGEELTPLPLSTNVAPGDTAYCFSDPVDRRGYFSQGIVNRFYQPPARRRAAAPGPITAPLRINVSTDWAPGSSGSAVLDECGNVIGQVSTISAFGDEDLSATPGPHDSPATLIVFHEAVSARDVLALIRQAK